MKKILQMISLLLLAFTARADESLTIEQARPLVDKIQQGMCRRCIRLPSISRRNGI